MQLVASLNDVHIPCGKLNCDCDEQYEAAREAEEDYIREVADEVSQEIERDYETDCY